MNRLLLCLFLIYTSASFFAQETFPVNGTYDKDVIHKVFINAKIYVDFETAIENATLVISKDKIIAAGTDIVYPSNSVVYDLEGMWIYPSFIDLDSKYGMPKVERPMWKPSPQYESNKKGAFGWNEAIKPETDASQLWDLDEKSAGEYRKMGFGTVMTHTGDGIARGTAALVCLGSNDNRNLLLPKAAAEYSFSKGSSRQQYPSSQMGSIALLRQTYYDARWYASEQNSTERNLSLEAFNMNQDLPQIFNSNEKYQILRADKIGDEFGVQYIFTSRGDDYQRIEEIKGTNGALIVPLNFPSAYDVSDLYLERLVSLEEMKHWELAPGNAGHLEQNEIDFCLSSEGLNSKNFLSNLRKAVENGLSEKKALEALTKKPAEFVNAYELVGSLNSGKEANFIICSGNIFESETEINENWVQGERFVIKSYEVMDITGDYELTMDGKTYPLTVSGSPGKYLASFDLIKTSKNEEGVEVLDTAKVKLSIVQLERQLSMKFQEDDVFEGVVRLNGNAFKESKIWEGQGTDANGNWFEWVSVKQDKKSKEDKADDTKAAVEKGEKGELTYPLMAYGWSAEPNQETILFTNVTLWTCEKEGKIEKGEILIHQGKIKAIGERIDLEVTFPKGEVKPKVIDASGKHISPGIIDEHSHIAVSGSVNESAQASSAEVGIWSVIDSDDINIYRQLSGGVTAAQILHGSANPIGGQSGIIKLRWGQSPDEMLIKEAVPFIKFALGENVKQSNWGSYETVRFPQTRMGVEQVYYDHFIRAREYDLNWKTYNNSVEELSPKQIRKGEVPLAPRTDLELECLAQILNSERFITCHSYRQDEINMLMHVADSMHFRLNTFTHILEGYKVADKMKEHGAGGSTFSDWWAYKFEVKDAIPYNAAVLYEQGVVTAINSDDAEMARRLNQEAAKAVKYGDVPEMEALKMVTLNPAKLLHLDEYMGSLKVGKDADIVLWSDNPLSIYAKAEMTFVDGRCYFSIEEDLKKREQLQAERNRLVQKMLTAAEGGAATQKPTKKGKKNLCCDSEDNGYINYIVE